MTTIVLLATHVMAGIVVIVVSIVRVVIAEALVVSAIIEMTAIAVDTEISQRVAVLNVWVERGEWEWERESKMGASGRS